jgi:gas vesicle protein
MREQDKTDSVWSRIERWFRAETVSTGSLVSTGVFLIGMIISPLDFLDKILGVFSVISIVVCIFSYTKRLFDSIKNLADRAEAINKNLADRAEAINKNLADHAKAINESLSRFNRSLEELNETTMEVLTSAVSCVSDLAGAKFIPEGIIENKKEKISEVLTSIRFNLSSWGRIFEQQSGDELTEIWLETCTTYFREESIDIQRRELVTNSRNYTFLLLQTLMAFLRRCNEGEKVLVYAVTPIHPRDWYNWPHGRNKPRIHYEEDFMRLYRGLLQEIITQYSSKLDVTRVVLSAENDSLRSAFEWTLSRFDTDYDKLEHWFIVDIPVRPRDLPHFVAGVHGALHVFPQDVFVVPAYYSGYSYFDDQRRLYHHTWKIVIDAVAQWRDKAKEILKQDMRSQLDSLKDSLKKESSNNGEGLQRRLDEYIEQLEQQQLDLLEFIRFMQMVSVRFPNLHRIADGCIVSVLRYLNSKNVDQPQKLKELWISRLHSDNQAYYHILTSESINHWTKIAPSFVMFGKKNSNQQDEWKLVILSDIHYPFVTSRIRYITSEEELKNYMKLLESIKVFSFKEVERNS